MKLSKGGIVVTTSVIFIGFLLAGFYFALALWFFPHIDRYTPKLEKLLSDTMNAKVTIKRTTARWQGITPHFSFDEVTISGKTKLSFAHIEAGLALWRLPKVRFAHLALMGSDLSLWRDREKHWYLAGASLDGGGDSPFIRWLLQQGKISFHKTTLFFEDQANQLPPFVLKTDDFFWKRKYGGIAFAGHFDADPAFATQIGVKGLWKEKQETLAGAIKLSLIGLDTSRLGNSWLKGGKGDVDLDLQGERKNFLFKFSGHMHDVYLKLNDKPPLHIAQLSGNLLWNKDDKDQKIVLKHFAVAIPGQTAKPTSGQIFWNNEHGNLAIDHLDFSTVNIIAKSLPLKNNPLGQRFTASGNLEKIDASWQGMIVDPLRYHFSLTAINFSLAEKNGDFGVTHLFGRAHGNEKGGSLDVASASTINLAQTFANPLRFEELTGTFLWGIDHERFNLSLKNFRLRNKDFHGVLELHYYHRPSENELVLDLDLQEVALANVVHYFPRHSSENLKKWLAQSLIGGKATRLTLHLGGDLDRFPFVGEKPPGFSLRAQLADAALAYSPAWPMLTGIDGTLTIENEKLSIQARKAKMGHLLWHDLEATIANYVSPKKILMVKGESQGDGHAFMQTLFSTPLRNKLTALENLKVSGPGALKLALDIDLDNPDDTKSQGEYHFEQTTIAYGKAVSLQQASGALFFKDNRFTAQPVEGFMFGGKTSCALKTLDSGDIQLDCEGLALAENLKQRLWPNLPVSGQTAWTGTLIAGQDKSFLHIGSNLQGLRLNLPPPIQKDDSEKSEFNLDLAFRQQATQWRLRYANKDVMDGEWWTDPKAPGYKITHGIFRINDHTPPPSSGLWITGNLEQLTMDDWLACFAGNGQTSGFSPSRIRLDAKKLKIFNRVFAQTALEATLADGGLWRIHAHGNDLLGELTFGKHTLQAHFSRLNIGGKQPTLQAAGFSDHGLTSIPNLDIHVQELIFEEKNIGAFDLVATPKKDDIVIEQLQIAVPDGTFNGQGLWKNWRSNPSTDWKIELKTSNLGHLLQRYGLDGQVVGGEGSITGQLHVPEPPYAIDFTQAQGDVHFEFRKGRLIKLDTGIFGRLLGLVRLEALPRRFMLDFSDLFEKGFTFDLLKGESQLGNQKVTIPDMVIAGPPGGFFVSGHVDLVQKSQALIVRFVPVTFVGDGLAIGAGILGGPAAGLGAFILQKALGDPLGKMLTFEYQVSGTWSDPKVQPLAKASEPKGGG